MALACHCLVCLPRPATTQACAQVLRAQGCKAKVTVNATAGAHLEVAQTNPRFANLDAVLQARRS